MYRKREKEKERYQKLTPLVSQFPEVTAPKLHWHGCEFPTHGPPKLMSEPLQVKEIWAVTAESRSMLVARREGSWNCIFSRWFVVVDDDDDDRGLR